MALRAALQAMGIKQGVQWLDGSFVEDIETLERRPPRDIDVVTFAPRPVPDLAQWRQLIGANLNVFDATASKQAYQCDHYFVDTTKPVQIVVSDAVYFISLFSHRRQTFLWKGLVRVPLGSDDPVAALML